MNKKYSIVFLAFCYAFLSFSQVDINSFGVDYTIDFDSTVPNVNTGQYTGNGFLNNPPNGYLDADAWAIKGFSDGNKPFGSEFTVGDYARGAIPGTTGGLYGTDIGSGNHALVIRPSTSDWNPGSLGLVFKNNTGSTLTSIQVSYKIIIKNNGNRSSSFNFAHSSTDTNYTLEPSLNYNSPEVQDSNDYFAINQSIKLSSLSILDGSLYYLEWSSQDVSGSLNRDLIGIDDITIRAIETGPIPELQLSDNSSINQNCGYTMNFGGVVTNGSFSDSSFNILNTGSSDLNINSLSISGDYSIIAPVGMPILLPPNSTQTVSLRFIPSSDGLKTGLITIQSNDSDEGLCNINLNGTGLAPAPEIDIEKNTLASITNNSSANTGNNTVFASTFIDNTSAPKTYYIRNEGTADLIVTSLVSSNTAEFSILGNPAPLVLTPGQFTSFEISFKPIGTGTRTSMISIVSNDADENPYIINVRGTGICKAATLYLTPASGPVNTVVKVTGTNFGTSTTASIGGLSSSVKVISDTEIEVTIPPSASSNSLKIVNDLACSGSAYFKVIDRLIESCEGNSGVLPSDLFISEITDKGTGSHTYIEIYNGTGSPVNLTAESYQIRIHNNGSPTALGIINLTGVIPNNSVIVAAIGGSNAMDTEGGYTAKFFSTHVGINEDDNIRLYKAGNWVDLWGDPTGIPFTISSNDYTYRRKNSEITAPSTVWQPDDWKAISPVNYSDIGTYDFSIGSAPSIIEQPSISYNNCSQNANIQFLASEGFIGNKPLTYQWYYLSPGSAVWAEVTNGTIYSNATTSTLEINDTSTLDDYQFYAEVRENTVTCYQATHAVKINSGPTIWDGTQWNNEPPTIDKVIILNGDYDTSIGGIQTSFSACSLVINPSSELLVSNDTYIEIENDLTVNGSMIVSPSGSVVQISNSGIVNGAVLSDKSKIVVEKETAPISAWYEYTYWSSPVVGEMVGNALFQTNSNRRFIFNASNYQDSFKETNNNNATVPGQDDVDDDGNDWVVVPATDIMKPGVGYAATLSQTSFIGTARYKHFFEGPFNNGSISVPVVRNDDERADTNWNFIGNPYPSAIDADLFLNLNTYSATNPDGTIDGAIYLWSQNTAPSSTNNGNQALNFAQSDYAVINGSGEIAGGDMVKPNRFIPSGQGFFVSFSDAHATASGFVNFDNRMRSLNPIANSQFFRKSKSKKSETETHEKLWINLTSDNGIFNQICIAYLEGATQDYDGMYYDALRNLSTNTAAKLYSRIENEDQLKFAIQGRSLENLNSTEKILLGFYSSIELPTIFTLSIENLRGAFLNSNPIFLKDNLLGITHELSKTSYSFTSAAGEINERFEIAFNQETLSAGKEEINTAELKIIELNDGKVRFYVNQQTISQIEIFDMFGRKLYSQIGHGKDEIMNLSSMSQSTYFAKVLLSNGKTLVKKSVKRL